MGVGCFQYLCGLLKATGLFDWVGNGRPPRPVEYQLSVFLRYYGSSSTNKHFDSARDTSVGTGSVRNYVQNVTAAIRAIEAHHLTWPSLERKGAIVDGFGWPGCIGAVDGSLIPLTYIPTERPYQYYSRKKFYAVGW